MNFYANFHTAPCKCINIFKKEAKIYLFNVTLDNSEISSICTVKSIVKGPLNVYKIRKK